MVEEGEEEEDVATNKILGSLENSRDQKCVSFKMKNKKIGDIHVNISKPLWYVTTQTTVWVTGNSMLITTSL